MEIVLLARRRYPLLADSELDVTIWQIAVAGTGTLSTIVARDSVQWPGKDASNATEELDGKNLGNPVWPLGDLQRGNGMGLVLRFRLQGEGEAPGAWSLDMSLFE